MKKTQRNLNLCAALALTACGTQPGDRSSDQDLTGAISFALEGNTDVLSVLLDVQNAQRGVTRCVNVDGGPTTVVDRLPTRAVTIQADAFDAPDCEGHNTWYVEPMEVELARGVETPVRLRFRPNGVGRFTEEYVDEDAAPTRCGSVAADANTVILEQFEGATSGTIVGAGTLVDGAIEFAPGGFLKLAQPLAGTSRSVEFCVMPLEPANGHELIDYNWGNTDSRPPAGHVFWMNRQDGTLATGVWNSTVSMNLALSAPGEVAEGEWSHIAVTFSPSVSKVYIDGEEVASTGGNFFPDASPTTVYLNGWGGMAARYDDLHISAIVRSAEEIRQHAGL